MSRIKLLAPVVFVIALGVALGGCSRASSSAPAATAGAAKPVIVQLLVKAVPHGVGDSIEKGQSIKVKSTGVVVGTIESVEVTPTADANPDSKGTLVESPSPVTDQIVVTIKGTAVVSETGFRFGNGNLYVNSENEYLTPTTILHGFIVSIAPGS